MKDLTFSINEQALPAALGSKVTKDQLYGDVIKLVEKEGRKLQRGYLMPDGDLVRRSQLASVAVDPEGTPVEPLQVYREDQAIEAEPSSFDQPMTLSSVPLKRLVGFNAADVYQITPQGLSAGLYETRFNYRKSYNPRAAMILVKEDGQAFLLVGSTKATTFVGKNPAYEFFDVGEEEDGAEADPLDFAMM